MHTHIHTAHNCKLKYDMHTDTHHVHTQTHTCIHTNKQTNTHMHACTQMHIVHTHTRTVHMNAQRCCNYAYHIAQGTVIPAEALKESSNIDVLHCNNMTVAIYLTACYTVK